MSLADTLKTSARRIGDMAQGTIAQWDRGANNG